MEWLYLFTLKIYGAGIFAASFFDEKARKWIEGRKNIFEKISPHLSNKREKRIWFHCASLGEFEQGKPVLSELKKEYPDHKIVLTFFSPSGYEQKKKEPLADYVFYMPLDGTANAKKFITEVSPSFAVFVKYEFWHFYIRELKKRKIPLYIISARFRRGDIFFRWYGFFFRKILRRVTHLFVQDQQSLEIIYDHGFAHVTVSGDTRFDRVYENATRSKSFSEIEKFTGTEKVFIAGSTWREDEKILAEFINSGEHNLKFIIAPHEISNNNIRSLKNLIQQKTVLFSELNTSVNTNADVLILDNVGMLASIYKYGHIAYVGGAFGKGLHNILEAVVFGLPVLFGPGYKKFPEAVQLINSSCAFPVSGASELKEKVRFLLSEKNVLDKIKEKNHIFIDKNRGATAIIMNYIRMNYK